MSNTISQNLTRLQNAQASIATAIQNKGGTVGSQDGFEEFPNDILSIPTSEETLAFLFVTTTAGTTITVSKNGTTLDPQTSTSGEELCFKILSYGTWTVSGDNDITKTISISQYGSYYVKIDASIYGVEWDKTTTSILKRTDDSSSFSDPVPFVNDGNTQGSSPFDNIYPWKDICIETIEGNDFVKIPKFWYKIENTSDKFKLQISDKQVSGFSVSPAHMDRGDGEGERDYVYIGRYKSNSTNYKSTTNSQVMVSKTMAQCRTGCSSVGTYYWQQDYTFFCTIRFLYLVEFAYYDSKKSIGVGGLSNGMINTGTTDSMPYHTGTMLSDKTTTGAGIQYRYIEDMCSGEEWLDGINAYNNVVYIEINPTNFKTGKYGVATEPRRGITAGSGTHYYAPRTTTGYDWAIFPAILSSSTGSGIIQGPKDYYSCSTNTYTVYIGSSSSNGMFAISAGNGPGSGSDTSTTRGCRLMYLPPNS